MNPQDALKLVQDQEAKERESVEKEEKRLGWIQIANGVAQELGLITKHDLHYDNDGRVSLPYCPRCSKHSYRDAFDKDGPCIRPYTESVGAAFELVDHITARGWTVAFVLDPAHPYDKVLIQAKPRTQNLVEIMFRNDNLPKAIVGMAAAWAKRQKEAV